MTNKRRPGPKPQKPALLAIRVLPDVRDDLEQWAESDNRSISSVVDLVIRDAKQRDPKTSLLRRASQPGETKSASIGIRLSEADRAWVVERAEAEVRSVSSFVDNLICDALERRRPPTRGRKR